MLVFQSHHRANGGVRSITQIIERSERLASVVVTERSTPVNDLWRAAGAEVLLWPLPEWHGRSLLSHAWTWLVTNIRLYRLVRSRGVRAVICNDIRALWHGAFGARAAGANVMFVVRGVKAAGESYGLKWRLAGVLSHRIVALSREMRDALVARAFGPRSAARVSQVYSPVDTAMSGPVSAAERLAARGRLGIAPDAFAIGVIGAFWWVKAQLPFIERAAPEIVRQIPRAQIHFVGDYAPEQDEYSRRCAEACRRPELTGRCLMHGFTTAVSDWYRALDAVVVPSVREGLNRAMIESLAAGTPVVSFDVCSAREILEGHGCGLVVSQGDWAGLSAAVRRLAEDPQLRRLLGDSGVTTVRRLFHPDVAVRAFEAEVLAMARPAS